MYLTEYSFRDDRTVQLTEDEAFALLGLVMSGNLHKSTLTTLFNPDGAQARLDGSPDRILVYVPASGEGVFLSRAELLQQLQN